ncbi:MAG TPA: Na+/H+ antiporter NhaC [Acidobacteriota bacterium]|nr:Na+/H+ antiporter NhaC [Acidobacteriota bacterium]
MSKSSLPDPSGGREPSVDPLEAEDAEDRRPSLGQSLIPVVFLIAMLAASVYLFGGDSSYGPNQIALLLAASVGFLVGMSNGFGWKEMEQGVVHSIGLAMGAILILLVVGSLIGTWIMAGIVPTMIYYGLQVLHPSIFLPAACIICAVVSLATGSSWTTVSTIGIALIGIAGALDLSLALAAGAIISGAYFGDKLSPLSDTTNLAPAMVGTDLFTHIRHMLWTTVPSMVIALILYTVIGIFSHTSGQAPDLGSFLTALQDSFTIGWYLLIPPAIVLLLVLRKVPAFPALLIGALVGGLFAIIFQTDLVLRFADPEGQLHPAWALVKGFWTALHGDLSATPLIASGNEDLDALLNRGGMYSMLNTVWLILSAMVFGGVMEVTGMLQRLSQAILGFAHSTGTLITATLATSIGSNIIASDQYIAIVLPGRMFRAEFERRGLHPKNLSRCMEDAGTLTSPLIPWNTCGAFMSATLSVATFTYLPFCFVNLLNPVISAFYGFTGFTIERIEPEGKRDLNQAA